MSKMIDWRWNRIRCHKESSEKISVTLPFEKKQVMSCTRYLKTEAFRQFSSLKIRMRRFQ